MRGTSLKILLTLASLGGIAALAIGGTYANFTATPTTISNNAFATGTLTMSRTGSGAVFSAAGMKIGDEATGSVTINNTGTLPGAYSLSASADSGSSATLASKLNLVIYKDTDGSGTPVYSGALSGVSSASLGTFAKAGATGDSHTFYFHVTLPTTGTDAGDNALQGLSASETFTWSATQV
jgi:predicted ribosomally synthesized peptide with SipW-like signal peptide